MVTADWARGFVRDIGADKVEFKFKKPKSIEIGGSYPIGCVAKPDVNVDLLLRLPKVHLLSICNVLFTIIMHMFHVYHMESLWIILFSLCNWK